ncbi:MAG: methyltransferase domain-containing protein [Nitratireductor sp.]|nr:methyltransferase domain-containing protein [Nitratireductor sp.]
MTLKLDIEKDIKPYFYIRGNFDIIRCTDHLEFDTVFDVGCGKGGASLYFANQGKKVTAITIGEEFHSYREDWFDAFGIEVEVGDFALYKTDNKFDAVWMSHSLEHTQNPGIFLENAWNMLNNRGWLLLLVPPYNHLLTSGHFSTGWNMGTIMYNLLVSGFDIKNGHFARFGSNLCAFVQKNGDYHLPPGSYVSIDESAPDWPLPVHHHSSLDEVYQVNWFDDFQPKLKKEADRRKRIKNEDNKISNFYMNLVLNSKLTKKKFLKFANENKGKAIVCYGAGLFAKKAMENMDFSKLNIIGFIDADERKQGTKICDYEIYSINEINRSLKPDIILMTCTKKMWGKHHVIPIQAKRGLGGAVIVDEVFSLSENEVSAEATSQAEQAKSAQQSDKDLRAALDNARLENAALLNSTSWKVTAPLRSLVTWFRNPKAAKAQ